RGRERGSISPLPEAGLDEALCLAVGARCVWPGSDMAKAGLGEQRLEGVTAIGRAVVAHDPLDADAVRLEEGQGPAEEGAGALLLIVGQKLGVGEPRGVVDSDVQALPADAAALVHAGMVAGNAVADA